MCCSKGGRKRERNGRGSGGRNDGSGHHSESNEWAQPHSYKLLSYFRLKSFGSPKFIPRIFSSSPGNPYRSYSHFPPFSLPFLIISLLLLLFSSWLLNTEQSESDFIPVLWCGVIGGRRFGCVPFLFSLQKISGFSSWKQNFLFSQSQQKKMAVKMFSVVASFWKNKLKSSNAAKWGLMCWIVFDWSIWYACFPTNSWFGCLKTC